MSYAVSAFHERSDHMSPVAALLAALLHAATAAALIWMVPVSRHDLEEDAIEVTVEQPKPPEPTPVQEAIQRPVPPPPPPPVAQPAPPPPPPPAAAAKPEPKPEPTPKPEPKPQEQITSKVQPGVEPPAPVKPEPPKQEKAKPGEATLEPPKPAGPKPPEPEAKPQPAQEAAATPPPSPPPQPEPPLEKVVPPVETPPAPLTMRDFVKVMPPPAPRTPPAPPPQTLQHSPLSPGTTPQPQNAPSASVSSFTNPAAEAANTSAKNAYLVGVLRKFSQYLPNLREKNEGGTVVLRFVIARDGRLVDATILKSSGVVALDKGLLDALRAAAPYPPLPLEIAENQVVFVQSIQARQ